ncbi:hypothetical protein BD779DRAFT_1675175 [Infundibulicybe gibba]|nr:hypothetical protein BD779DRAFT_1675175 [Infundibulicybe gibba]
MSRVLRLLCLTRPNNDMHDNKLAVSEVEVADDRTVAALKNLIKLTYPRRFASINAADLVLWKCSGFPCANLREVMDTAQFDGSDVHLARLDEGWQRLSQYFGSEDVSMGPIHIIVEVRDFGKCWYCHNVLSDTNGFYWYHTRNTLKRATELASLRRMRVRFVKIVYNLGRAPSIAAKYNKYTKTQMKQKLAIHDGLHPGPMMESAPSKLLTTVAPPIYIFHPIFEQFVHDANDPSLALPRKFLIRVREFMTFSSLLKTNEPANPEVLQRLPALVGVSILRGRLDSSGRHVPVRNNPWQTCSGLGPGYSTRRSPMYILKRSRMRDRCCCPTFVVAGGGPWMCVLGVVFTDKDIVQRLTDMMWIRFSSTNEDDCIYHFVRVMMALHRNLPRLQEYYEKTSTADIPPFDVRSLHPRFYPYPMTFAENSRLIQFDYMKMLGDESTCVTYQAKIRNDVEAPETDKLVVVKFVDQYGHEGSTSVPHQ